MLLSEIIHKHCWTIFFYNDTDLIYLNDLAYWLKVPGWQGHRVDGSGLENLTDIKQFYPLQEASRDCTHFSHMWIMRTHMRNRPFLCRKNADYIRAHAAGMGSPRKPICEKEN